VKDIMVKTQFCIRCIAIAMCLDLYAVQAQDALHSPPAGSPERKAIMDALRIPVEKELKQNVVFVTQSLKVESGWAFLSGKPQQKNGKPVDYSITEYSGRVEDGMFDDNIFALLQRRGTD